LKIPAIADLNNRHHLMSRHKFSGNTKAIWVKLDKNKITTFESYLTTSGQRILIYEIYWYQLASKQDVPSYILCVLWLFSQKAEERQGSYELWSGIIFFTAFFNNSTVALQSLKCGGWGEAVYFLEGHWTSSRCF
jgi:hypothetical protein